jgi:hypothetical protein
LIFIRLSPPFFAAFYYNQAGLAAACCLPWADQIWIAAEAADCNKNG